MVQKRRRSKKKEGGPDHNTTCSHTIRDEDGRAAVCYYIKGKITSSRESVESSQFFGRHIHATTCCRSSTHIVTLVKIFKRKYRLILFGYIFYLLGLVLIPSGTLGTIFNGIQKGKNLFFF